MAPSVERLGEPRFGRQKHCYDFIATPVLEVFGKSVPRFLGGLRKARSVGSSRSLAGPQTKSPRRKRSALPRRGQAALGRHEHDRATLRLRSKDAQAADLRLGGNRWKGIRPKLPRLGLVIWHSGVESGHCQYLTDSAPGPAPAYLRRAASAGANPAILAV